jgi:hypothetical protein
MNITPRFVGRAVAAALSISAAPTLARSQGISVLTSTVEEHEATAGEMYTGRIVIANASRTPQAARIYQTDYRFLADGRTFYDDPGTTPRSNAKWITPQSQRVVVPANGQVTVPYTVRVPADSIRGTYWSQIMVEGATVAPTNSAGGNPQVGIGAVLRYGIQVVTHIGSTGKRAVTFENPSATRDDKGEAGLDLDVISSGDRGVRPKMSVELYDTQGVLRAKASKQRGLLYPGTSLRQHFDFGALPKGTYKAVIFADTGDEAVLAKQFTIAY